MFSLMGRGHFPSMDHSSHPLVLVSLKIGYREIKRKIFRQGGRERESEREREREGGGETHTHIKEIW